MPTDLEQLITTAADNGSLNSLSLLAKPGGKWEACFLDTRRASGYVTTTANDPVTALVDALTTPPSRRRVKETTEEITK